LPESNLILIISLSDEIFLEVMSWDDVRESLKSNKIILIPTGSIEQHGPHLPLYSDVIAPLEVAILVAKKLNCLIAPPLRPGVSAHHLPFSGTISLRPGTFISIVKDYASSLSSHGYDPIVFINGHGGNSAAMSVATYESRFELSPTHVIGLNWWEFIPKSLGGGASGFDEGFHAGSQETSWVLALRPQYVRMEKAKKEMPRATDAVRLSEGFYFSTFKSLKDVSESGILGDATRADAELGLKLIEAAAENIAAAIGDVVSKNKK
jgi:creatinine amidohydrolase